MTSDDVWMTSTALFVLALFFTTIVSCHNRKQSSPFFVLLPLIERRYLPTAVGRRVRYTVGMRAEARF